MGIERPIIKVYSSFENVINENVGKKVPSLLNDVKIINPPEKDTVSFTKSSNLMGDKRFRSGMSMEEFEEARRDLHRYCDKVFEESKHVWARYIGQK